MTDLQPRLARFAKLMFAAFVLIRGLEVLLYQVYPQITPQLYPAIFTTGVITLVIMAVCWRIVLVRRTLSARRLGQIDVAVMTASGTVFGATAVLAWDRHESAYTCLIYSVFLVFMRAIVVPSSGRRTAIVATAAMTPLWIAAVLLAFTTTQDVPRGAFIAGALLYTSIAIAIAAIGSRSIYGLRRRVEDGMQLGQYTLVGKVGSAHRAYHALLRRPTVIKLLARDRLRARREQAVQAMSRLEHPNTLAIFDYGRTPDGTFYYAMEYTGGIELAQLVAEIGPLPVDRVVAILVQICGSLQEAHDRGIVHGDVSPANVILCERGGIPDVVKLTEFGMGEVGDIAGDLRGVAEVGAFLHGGPLAALADKAQSARALSRRLQALAPAGDWTREQARAWWRRNDNSPADSPSAGHFHQARAMPASAQTPGG